MRSFILQLAFGEYSHNIHSYILSTSFIIVQDPASSIFVQSELGFFLEFYTCQTLRALIGRYTS